jgi:electron transport complex protein RnfA
MEYLTNLFTMAIFAVLINNFILSRFLGLCSYLGVTNKIDSAFGMGMAVTFVMTMTAVICYLIRQYILIPYDMLYLSTIAFIIVIAALVQFVEMVIQKNSPALYKALGIYLPLIVTNCAVLAVALINAEAHWGNGKPYNFLDATLNGFFCGIGYTLVMLLMAGIRERLEYVVLPKSMSGMTIALITGGIMALAFYGFVGFKI